MSAYEMAGATARLICDSGESEHVEVVVYNGLLEPLPLEYNLGRGRSGGGSRSVQGGVPHGCRNTCSDCGCHGG
jgi:hypothetical protein